MSETAKRVVKNSISRIGGYVVGAGLFFAAFVLIARYLGTEQFGRFSFILAMVGILERLADMGVRNLLIRNIAVDRDNFRYHLGIGRTLLWLLSLLSMAMVVILANLLSLTDEARQATYLAGLGAMAFFQGMGYSALLRAYEEMGWDILGFTFHKVSLFVSIWLVSQTAWGLRGVFVAFFLANTCQWLYYWGFAHMRHGRVKLNWNLRAVWALHSQALPLGIAEMLKRLARHVDKILLTALSTPTAVGIFSAAYQLPSAIDPSTLTLPLFPIFSRLAHISSARLFRAYEQSLKFIYVVSFPVAVLLFVFSERIMVLFFGEPYREGATALRLLSPVVIFLFMKSVYGYVYTALGKQHIFMGCMAASLVANTLTDLMLIPFYGYTGAALGTLCGEAVLFLSGLVMLRRFGSGIDTLSLLWRPCLAGLIMGFVLWQVKDRPLASLLLGGGAGLALYAGGLLALQTFTQQERVLVMEALRIRLGSAVR